MKCSAPFGCHRNIRPGLESAKRVEYWALEDPPGSILVLSDAVPDVDGKLADVPAGWRLAAAAHNKCYWAERKRTARAADAAEHAGIGGSGGAAAQGG